MLRWMGLTFARFMGLVMVIYGGWLFGLNLSRLRYEGWVLVWVLSAGLLGFLGGVAYLLTFDGPPRLRTRRLRWAGWSGMLYCASLPTSLTLMVLPLVLLVGPFFGPFRVPATSE